MKSPKVSILCIAYNQAEYIRQTLDSFLMQEADFAYEVLINDDASTDGTAEIIKEYQNKYPKIIKPVFQKENQYSKGLRNFMVRFLIPKAKGKYFALCEGDDYWTDPKKLQKQADFMDENSDFAICFHPVRMIHEDNSDPGEIFPPNKPELTVSNLLKANFIQTNSVMYRKNKYEGMNLNVIPGDWYLHLYHAQFGKIGFIDEIMSVYRRHAEGIWSDSFTNRYKFWEKYGKGHLDLCRELLKMYGDNQNYRQKIYNRAADFISDIAQSSEQKGLYLIEAIIKDHPEFAASAISIYQHNLKLQKDENNNLKKNLDSINTEAAEQKKLISQIYGSTTFKLSRLILLPIKILKKFKKSMRA